MKVTFKEFLLSKVGKPPLELPRWAYLTVFSFVLYLNIFRNVENVILRLILIIGICYGLFLIYSNEKCRNFGEKINQRGGTIGMAILVGIILYILFVIFVR